MFSAGGTYFNVKIQIGNTTHNIAVLKEKNIGRYARILYQHGLTQENLGDASVQLTYMVEITKEKR